MSQMSSQETQLNYFEQMKPAIIFRISPLNDCLDTGFIIIVKCLTVPDPTKTFKGIKQTARGKAQSRNNQQERHMDSRVKMVVWEDGSPSGST